MSKFYQEMESKSNTRFRLIWYGLGKKTQALFD